MVRYYILRPLTTSNYGILQPRIGSPQLYQCCCPWPQRTVAALDRKSPYSYNMLIIRHQVDYLCQCCKFISIIFIPKCVPWNIYLWLWFYLINIVIYFMKILSLSIMIYIHIYIYFKFVNLISHPWLCSDFIFCLFMIKTIHFDHT